MLTERERINEAISSWFEPKPDIILTADRLRARWYGSPKGEWTLHRFNNASPDLIESFYWTPKDYYTDEAANARLLEAMPSPVLALETLHAPQWGCWPNGLHLTPERMRGSDPDRKTAIVLAFLKFARIEVAHEAS